jgi:arylamine N-acetyltransferase
MKVIVTPVLKQYGYFWQSDVSVYGEDTALLNRVHQALRRHMAEGEWSIDGGLWACANPRDGVLRLISFDDKPEPIHRVNRVIKFLAQFHIGGDEQNAPQ